MLHALFLIAFCSRNGHSADDLPGCLPALLVHTIVLVHYYSLPRTDGENDGSGRRGSSDQASAGPAGDACENNMNNIIIKQNRTFF